ncbi:MAG: TIGR03943 family protein [Leptolyngbyaceae cyanobacterium bins.59]|nr:TIGR03943 family protein [Leptolyngbyaceae cyanobacterium bins.59]
MSASSSRRRRAGWATALPWLDLVALALWGGLFLKYWVTGKLFILIHPNYMALTIAAGIVFLVICGVKALTLLQQTQKSDRGGLPHLTVFPPGWGTAILIVAAIAGLLIEPRAFASQTAIQRGLTDSTLTTRTKPQAFRSSTRPEERSIVDWVRTLNVYPEPDAYTGQKVKVQGFAVHPPQEQMPEQYLLISRFVITCCAADVYPVGLPVKLKGQRSAFPADQWFEVEGQMITETLGGKRQLVIHATSLKPIQAPKNPYEY